MKESRLIIVALVLISAFLIIGCKSNDKEGTLKMPTIPGDTVSCGICHGKKYLIRDCLHCNGDSLMLCDSCIGKEQFECEACMGTGGNECAPCIGSGLLVCSDCQGYGMGPEGGQCPSCGTRGHRMCPTCNGTGRDACIYCEGTGLVKCPKCVGAGKIKCMECGGIGKIKEPCPECMADSLLGTT